MTRPDTRPDTRPETVNGSTHVTSRALKQVVSAVAAEELGVRANQVGVQLADHDGLLEVTATAPLSVPDFSLPRQADDSEVSIVDRATAAQSTIRERVLSLTGSAIGSVTVRLSDAHIKATGRVN